MKIKILFILITVSFLCNCAKAQNITDVIILAGSHYSFKPTEREGVQRFHESNITPRQLRGGIRFEMHNGKEYEIGIYNDPFNKFSVYLSENYELFEGNGISFLLSLNLTWMHITKSQSMFIMMPVLMARFDRKIVKFDLGLIANHRLASDNIHL